MLLVDVGTGKLVLSEGPRPRYCVLKWQFGYVDARGDFTELSWPPEAKTPTEKRVAALLARGTGPHRPAGHQQISLRGTPRNGPRESSLKTVIAICEAQTGRVARRTLHLPNTGTIPVCRVTQRG